jgi:hypothetical protein
MLMPLLVLAAAAAAPPPSGAPPPVVVVAAAPTDDAHLDPKALAAARELLVSTGAQKNIVPTARGGAYTMVDAIIADEERKNGVKLPDDFKASLRAVIDQHLTKYGPELTAAIMDEGARIYARYFTVEELKELQRLQTNPVMVKYTAIAPQVVGAFMQAGVAAASVRQPELEAALKAAAERWAAQHAEQSSPRRS